MMKNMKQKGNDYPIGYVRWTEKRNFEAVLKCNIKEKFGCKFFPITQRFPLNEYQEIYRDISSSKSIASILEYSSSDNQKTTIKISGKSFVAKEVSYWNYWSREILQVLQFYQI